MAYSPWESHERAYRARQLNWLLVGALAFNGIVWVAILKVAVPFFSRNLF